MRLILLASIGWSFLTYGASVQVDSFPLDTPVLNAPIETIWVVNATDDDDSQILYQELKTGISTYYARLQQANIAHTSVYLSDDIYFFKGLPIKDNQGLEVLPSSATNFVPDFQERMWNGFAQMSSGAPIWALNLFLGQLAQLDIYPKQFGQPQVPVEIIAITSNSDWTQYEQKQTTFAQFAPSDYANAFASTLRAIHKGFHFSAIAPEIDNPPGAATVSNFLPLTVLASSGTYYSMEAGFVFQTALNEIADQVSLRASVFAKTQLALKKTPSDASQIVLRLRGEAFTSDMWQYLPAANAVQVHWELVPEVKLGDRLVVSYPVN